MYCAVVCGHDELVRLLISKKANPTLPHESGQTALSQSKGVFKHLLTKLAETSYPPRRNKSTASLILSSSVQKQEEEESVKAKVKPTEESVEPKPESSHKIQVFVASDKKDSKLANLNSKLENLRQRLTSKPQEESKEEKPLPPAFEIKDHGRVKEVRPVAIAAPKPNISSLFKQEESPAVDHQSPASLRKSPTKDYHSKTPLVVLFDEEKDESNLVHFGTSWRGELEKTRTFYSSSSIASVKSKPRPKVSLETFSSPSLDKSSNDSIANNSSSTHGKLYLQLMNMRGLVMNLPKMAEKSSLHCVITVDDSEPMLTNSIQCCDENMYTNIPLTDEFSFELDLDDDAVVKIELRLRLEFSQKPRRSFTRRLLRADSLSAIFRGGASSQKGIQQIHEQTVCQIQFNLSQIKDRCKDKPLERKWSWEVVEPETVAPSPERSMSSMRRTSLLSRASTRNYKGVADDRSLTADIQETGTLQLKSLYLEASSNEELPTSLNAAVLYVEQRQMQSETYISGFLSQQGGDIKYWRRRYFEVTGFMMNAYHEFYTDDLRTSIDLSQMVGVEELPMEVDTDRFPVKNSFRICFKHGEYIDFYADSKEERERWVSVLLKDIMSLKNECMVNIANQQEDAKASERKKKLDKRLKTPSPRKKASIDMISFTEEVEQPPSRNSAEFVGIYGTKKSKKVSLIPPQ